MQPDTALDIAFAIGAELVRNAAWDQNRCNWLIPVSDIFLGRTVSGFGMAGPTLYDGTAGTALFLSELARASDDPVIAEAAFGAIRHALSRVDDIPPTLRIASYAGAMGIATSALRIGQTHGRAEFIVAGRALARQILSEPMPQPCPTDIMLGLAGAIRAVLHCGDALAGEETLEQLCRWGHHLISVASTSTAGLSWDTRPDLAALCDERSENPGWLTAPQDEGTTNLLGFAHGASGIGLALIELGALSGRTGFVKAGLSAFAYEDSFLDKMKSLWPDLRSGADDTGTTVAWCHGTTGIGLARQRALCVQDHAPLRDDLQRARRATAESLRQRLRPNADFCLCHGIMGDLDLFLDPGTAPDGADEGLVDDVLTFGLETFHRPERPWSYGNAGAEASSSLMLGAAGIGYAYLRAADPANVSSVLV